jgi:ABC-type histidine transport system ATPase subunit
MIFLEGGRLIEEGSPEEIFTAPKEPRTKDFLGHVL